MNFKIGQEVVCVKTHSQGIVKSGELYVIKDLRLCASCKTLDIDVGALSKRFYWQCAKCDCMIPSDGVCWISHGLFKPLDELYNEELNEELNEIFSKQPFEI